MWSRKEPLQLLFLWLFFCPFLSRVTLRLALHRLFVLVLLLPFFLFLGFSFYSLSLSLLLLPSVPFVCPRKDSLCLCTQCPNWKYYCLCQNSMLAFSLSSWIDCQSDGKISSGKKWTQSLELSLSVTFLYLRVHRRRMQCNAWVLAAFTPCSIGLCRWPRRHWSLYWTQYLYFISIHWMEWTASYWMYYVHSMCRTHSASSVGDIDRQLGPLHHCSWIFSSLPSNSRLVLKHNSHLHWV